MKKKFNPKIYAGRARIERSLAGSPNVTKIFSWNPEKVVYEPNESSKCYLARRKRFLNGITQKEKKAFCSLNEAKQWQHEAQADREPVEKKAAATSPRFSYVLSEYRKNRMTQLKPSTQSAYNKLMNNKYFDFLKDYEIQLITPQVIDAWIRYLKTLTSKESRTSFKKEFTLLKTVLNYYAEYQDDYVLPLKSRHKKDIIVKASNGSKLKDLSEEQFLRFRDELVKCKLGKFLGALATVQFYQALRISEAAGLHREDIFFSPQATESRIRVTKSVHYLENKKGVIQQSFKNSKSNAGVKEQPLFPESYLALKRFTEAYPDRQGALFLQENGLELLTYRQIQAAYDRAFKGAGLDYSGTHIMRHGGARLIYDRSKGDFGATKQILGNADVKSVQVYAHRSTSALNEFCNTVWEDHLNKSQSPVPQSSADHKNDQK